MAVGDQDHVEFVKGLVDEADIVLLDCGVLGAAVCEFGEGCQESFNSGSLHIPELARDDGLAASGAYRRCENDLFNISASSWSYSA